jgi:DNA-binding IclR family transcriptional regulator
MESTPKVIQSVQRAIDILECFDYEKKELSLSEISEALNLNPSTVHGILLTLQMNEYIEKLPEKTKYKLGIKLIEKGTMVLDSLDLRDIVRPYLELLTNKFKETSHLCIYRNNTLYVIDKLESLLSTFFMTSEVGLKIPLHSSASGKLILAYLDEKDLNKVLKGINLRRYTENTLSDIDTIKQDLKKIKSQGYSFENEEIELGLYTIAAPIFNHKSDIIATISVLGPAMRMKEKQKMIVEDLVSYSKKISKSIGHN